MRGLGRRARLRLKSQEGQDEMNADLDGAMRYALDRLQNAMPAGLIYHDVRHTRDVVVPATAEIARAEGVTGEDLLLLLTAAWFHDLGYAETRAGHEAVSARLAAEVLPGFGYSPAQVSRVLALILSTEIARSPQDLLGMILVDADLDGLGSADFPDWSDRLRHEMAAYGQIFTDRQWVVRQCDFLARHLYFTPSARARRAAGIAKNLQGLTDWLNGLEVPGGSSTTPTK